MRISQSNCYLIRHEFNKSGIPEDLGGYANIIRSKINNEYFLSITKIQEFCYNSDKFKNKNYSTIEILSDYLDSIIFSALRYPPALALALEEINEEYASKEDFLLDFENILKKYLKAQEKTSFLMLEGVLDDMGYLSKGEFSWIVGYNPESNSLYWVSDDFNIYLNHSRYFDFRGINLKERFKDENIAYYLRNNE